MIVGYARVSTFELINLISEKLTQIDYIADELKDSQEFLKLDRKK